LIFNRTLLISFTEKCCKNLAAVCCREISRHATDLRSKSGKQKSLKVKYQQE